jgi:Uma2 family endonuclease
MATTRTRMTLEEFLARPDIDERRLELIDGEVCEKVSPTWGHARLAIRLGSILEDYGFAGAEPRAIIPPNHAPIADLAFYRADPPADDSYMTHPPDLMAEVTADFGERERIARKAELYREFGCRSVWIIDFARREVEVYEDGKRTVYGEGDIIRTAVVPELELPVAALFARTDRK